MSRFAGLSVVHAPRYVGVDSAVSLRVMTLIIARRIMASEWRGWVSWSGARRRCSMSQPQVRSTAQRFGMGVNPFRCARPRRGCLVVGGQGGAGGGAAAAENRAVSLRGLLGGGVGDHEELVAAEVHDDPGFGALVALRGGVFIGGSVVTSVTRLVRRFMNVIICGSSPAGPPTPLPTPSPGPGPPPTGRPVRE